MGYPYISITITCLIIIHIIYPDLLAQVNLHSCYQYDFDRIRVVFGNLIETVAPLIEAGIPSLKNLQKYLQRCFQELQPQLAKAESFDDVMDIIQDKCTVINVCCLDAIVDRYNIVEARLPIADFKATVDKFCEKVKNEICCNQSFMMASSSKYVTYETIVFFLEWDVDKYTLKEIRSLLSKAFKDVAKSVVVRTIKDNSTITLLVITNENFHLLKEMGLTKETIINQTTFDEVRNTHISVHWLNYWLQDKRDHLKETQWDAEDFQDKFKSGNLLIKETLTDWLRRNEAVGIIKMVSCGKL